ncbi:hypothetical protein BO71DRAFT_482524 [Aspergillus ellipticus CBS 707.79]|uniref:Zn(2)-C6 fungal-type domain-containing protein n=1 Tax=Aspergillus ellipticus CBS 707.79 TaxID=1448320 RepID=A0A319DF07_9EURO|nr:hypothetical protein BO71DRAFT_482524 [Aspergillus ellipticus CBS 707.79]
MSSTLAQKRAECSFCSARFSHRSSLVRHLRNNCNQSQQQQHLRRKACRQCVANKTRCNLKRPSCSRCQMRNLSCDYPAAKPADSPVTENSENSRGEDAPLDSLLQTGLAVQELEEAQEDTFEANLFDPLFPNLGSWDAAQPSDLAVYTADDAGGTFEHADSPELFRALSFPALGPEPPETKISFALATHSMELIFRVLRTWPNMLADEFQVPPLFHPTQIGPDQRLPVSLANCITLTKMWQGKCKGAEEMARRTILRELDSILDQDQTQHLEGAELIAVLQSVVIYAIILISPSITSQGIRPDHTEIFRKVQQLVYHVVRTGLFLPEERQQMRPSWDQWVHVTSKRRAVLALYLLHWAYSVLYRVPCFDCRDLGFMPAPAAKRLWQARTEQEWNKGYIQWLARWSGRGYVQGELGGIRPGVGIDRRAERWLEETDEFGFLMMAIVNATDYDPPSLKVLAP